MWRHHTGPQTSLPQSSLSTPSTMAMRTENGGLSSPGTPQHQHRVLQLAVVVLPQTLHPQGLLHPQGRGHRQPGRDVAGALPRKLRLEPLHADSTSSEGSALGGDLGWLGGLWGSRSACCSQITQAPPKPRAPSARPRCRWCPATQTPPGAPACQRSLVER